MKIKGNKPIIILIIGVSLVVTIGIILIALYLTGNLGNKSNKSNNNNKTLELNGVSGSGSLLGTWSSSTTCGRGSFDIISLASALPDNYNIDDLTNFFTGNIIGEYSGDMSNKKTKYLISVGGSNATSAGWTSMLSSLTNNINLRKFIDQCKSRGVVGIDWDLERTTRAMTTQINAINRELKKYDSEFKVMLTILLGSPTTFASLLDSPDNYDYLSLMLYNGGMYLADGAGAGCDWDGWAEIFLSKGTSGCQTPLKESREDYVKSANVGAVIPKKVLMGLIVDTTGTRLDKTIATRAQELVDKYQGGGVMLWVLPGWQKQDNISVINDIYNMKVDCSGGGGETTCPTPTNPCVKGSKCVATSCGKRLQGVTDEVCASCPEQGWWPCTVTGFCELGKNTF